MRESGAGYERNLDSYTDKDRLRICSLLPISARQCTPRQGISASAALHHVLVGTRHARLLAAASRKQYRVTREH